MAPLGDVNSFTFTRDIEKEAIKVGNIQTSVTKCKCSLCPFKHFKKFILVKSRKNVEPIRLKTSSAKAKFSTSSNQESATVPRKRGIKLDFSEPVDERKLNMK